MNDLLLIFTRNPELGKCKTRLAASVGDQNALDIYVFLLKHTARITKNLNVTKRVCYSEAINPNDLWHASVYEKQQQQGQDLGERMAQAFKQGFEDGFERIIIIGSDLFDLQQSDLEAAFAQLRQHEAVIGPASDGGYYLLGLTRFIPELFTKKQWGTSTVLEKTIEDLNGADSVLLEERNDVDVFEDIEGIPEFQPFLKSFKK